MEYDTFFLDYKTGFKPVFNEKIFLNNSVHMH